MTLNVSGLASGLDINNIIESLMEVERHPIRRNEARIERKEAIGEIWREVNGVLDTFKRSLEPLQNRLTYTAPVPNSSNEEVLKASVSGMPDAGSYRFNVTQLATNHTVATEPPTVGDRISSPEAALGLNGTFHLSTGRPPEGIDSLTFNQADTDWLRGNFGTGLQAVVDNNADSVFALHPEDLAFAEDYEDYDGKKINVYLDSFSDALGEDALEELEAYFAGKGWEGIDLENEPLFVIREEGEGWVAKNQNNDTFAFLGDHPLGTFDLRAEIVDGDDQVLAVNNFDFQIRNTVDDTGFITVKEGDSLLDIAEMVNFTTVNTGVSASVVKAEEGDYRLVFESQEEGTAGYIQAYDYAPLDAAGEEQFGTDSILAELNLLKGDGNQALPGYRLITEEAQNAIFTLNGLQMSRSSNTFTDVIDGLEISLEGTGAANLSVAPDMEAAAEEISLFVEAFNEVNSFLRRIQDQEDGPLQGSSEVMRMERQLRTVINSRVTDVPGSTHLRETLTYSGAGNVSATATGTYGRGSTHNSEALNYDGTGSMSARASGIYEGTASQLTLTYNEAAGQWHHDGVAVSSGDTIDGLTISLGAGSGLSNGDTLTLDVTPPPERMPTASEIMLEYNATAGAWRYQGEVFNSGDTIDGITIHIDETVAPAGGDTLILNVTRPTEVLQYNSLSEIGITTADEKGVLQIDNAKLQEALTVDPDGVFKLFARLAPEDAAGRKSGPDGVGEQLENLLKRLIGSNGVLENRQRALQQDIRTFQNRIEMIERRLEMREQRLIRQFTFMEQYIARIQEQTGLMTTFESMMQGQRD